MSDQGVPELDGSHREFNYQDDWENGDFLAAPLDATTGQSGPDSFTKTVN